MNTSKTVIEHVLSRLREIGITDVFGVPGDYSFPINDAICNDPDMRWIGCCNELNAAYAADGYARIRGMAALCTTYGVGELSAINGIAGSYAEHLPVFHLVGTPNMGTQSARAVMHHTLGNGEYGLFQKMSEPVVCAMAVMTPQNVAMETERLIAEALYHRRPVYMSFPADYANQPVASSASPIPAPESNPQFLKAAVDSIVDVVSKSTSPCFLPGILLARTGTQKAMEEVVDRSGLPFATMFMGKSVLDEHHPNYIGMYDGRLMNEQVREFVEGCDVIIEAGTMMSDFNSGAFTANLDPSKVISIHHHHTVVFGKNFPNIEMKDILPVLAERLPKRVLKKIPVMSLGAVTGKTSDPITVETLYPRWANFLAENDILIAETGTASMGLGFAQMPKGATFHNQTLWGSIGWATPASFGAAVAAPQRRVVLVTGDGSHQLTAQEICQFDRLNLKPVIFVLNNAGYLIERL
ncbi:MAG TPA: thiamine pyrophosphate-binding protein, partial [Puia sp.]|nr:thiamine pyrophosphate-binding protein [Puia sp.]